MRNKFIIFFLLFPIFVFGVNDTTENTWFGLIPALIAILLSVVTRKVLVSLFSAVVVGSVLVSFVSKVPSESFFGVETVLTKYIYGSAFDWDHVSVIIFSLLISSMVSVLRRSHSMDGVVLWISKYAKSKRSALFTTYFMGMVVFFDDYANTLVVGNTMRSITDKFKISREKLAYIVDATAAPIACIALVSTWIGYEVQLIDEGLKENGLLAITGTGYKVFLNSIAFSFYPIVTLIFIFILIFLKRDFGKMVTYELKANRVEEQEESSFIKSNIWKGIIPIITLILISFLGIYGTGEGDSVMLRIQSGNSYHGLLMGSGISLLSAILLNLKSGFKDLIQWIWEGCKELLPAISILILAWALNGVLKDLYLGNYLSELLNSSGISFQWIPALTFVLGGLIAFATGSSFSTMSILFPIIITISTAYLHENGIENIELFYCSIASVLSGAVLGDHCSPISDTTILSSMATGCDHVNHVSSQMPYAITVGAISLLLIILSCLYGVPSMVLIGLSMILSYLIIRLLGKPNS